jgi:hypothetical protein
MPRHQPKPPWTGVLWIEWMEDPFSGRLRVGAEPFVDSEAARELLRLATQMVSDPEMWWERPPEEDPSSG